MAALIAVRLSAFCQPILRDSCSEGIPSEAAIVVIVSEKPEETDLYAEEETMHSYGVPWLRISNSNDQCMIGPLVRPDAPGCSLCANTRVLNARMGTAPSVPELPIGEPTEQTVQAVSALAHRHISQFAASEAKRMLDGRPLRAEGRIYLLNRKTLQSSLHSFQPDPLCPICGRLPDDSPERATIKLKPALKRESGSFREKPLNAWSDTLPEQFLDARAGIINARFDDILAPFASTSVSVPSFAYGTEIAGGRSHSFASSHTAAMLEGLERHCAKAPQGYRTVVYDSYNRLAADALDPRTTGLYSQAQYRQPGFPFEPFDPDEPIEWVWGYSLTREKQVLVPRSLAYYSVNGGESWVNEGSNGCAIGGSLAEAILHGIFEVIERDAFLIAWYGQLPLRQLDPMSAVDMEMRLMISRIQAVAGYDLRLYNMTMEHGIPGILAIAKSERRDRMNLICAAGAHLDPLRAARSAVQEAAGLMGGLQDIFEREKERLMPMLHDGSLVARMEDHVLLYGLPEAEERLAFLLDQQFPPQSFEEAFGQINVHPDLAEDVRELVRTLDRFDLEVIVVNQTSPELERIGLQSVKVLVPGMLPMTFGHTLTRLTGLDRVLRVPAELGYKSKRLTYDSLNPYPHPFP